MDKVQFNNEVVTMRKIVKKVKVQVVRNLTRQIKQLRSKKGKPEELEKNRKRCERLVEVVQAMKRWAPDDVTYSALVKNSTVKDVMETPREKALSRLIKHPLFVKKLATFKDLVTPDMLQTKRLRKKVKTVSQTEASNKDDQTLTLQLKENEKQEPEPDFSKKSPSESGNDEESEDESDEHEGESFFLPSEKEKSLGNSNLESKPSSDRTLTDLRVNKLNVVDDTNVTSSEDEEEMDDQDDERQDVKKEKGRKVIPVAKVDLPNQKTKHHPKSRYIPGISAPVKPDQETTRPVFSNHGRGRGTSNKSHSISHLNSKVPPKMLPPHFRQSFSDRGRGRGHAINSVRGQGNSLPPKSINYQEKPPKSIKYQEQGTRSSLPMTTKKPFMEENKVEQHMHPSWLAKKSQRAGEKPVHFAGKKTTFSDG